MLWRTLLKMINTHIWGGTKITVILNPAWNCLSPLLRSPNVKIFMFTAFWLAVASNYRSKIKWKIVQIGVYLEVSKNAYHLTPCVLVLVALTSELYFLTRNVFITFSSSLSQTSLIFGRVTEHHVYVHAKLQIFRNKAEMDKRVSRSTRTV